MTTYLMTTYLMTTYLMTTYSSYLIDKLCFILLSD